MNLLDVPFIANNKLITFLKESHKISFINERNPILRGGIYHFLISVMQHSGIRRGNFDLEVMLSYLEEHRKYFELETFLNSKKPGIVGRGYKSPNTINLGAPTGANSLSFPLKEKYTLTEFIPVLLAYHCYHPCGTGGGYVGEALSFKSTHWTQGVNLFPKGKTVQDSLRLWSNFLWEDKDYSRKAPWQGIDLTDSRLNESPWSLFGHMRETSFIFNDDEVKGVVAARGIAPLPANEGGNIDVRYSQKNEKCYYPSLNLGDERYFSAPHEVMALVCDVGKATVKGCFQRFYT